ncbi:MAG: hypothetical protein PHR55_00270 [Bacilli bacterium]|nr:hypothetical protein [Bacilli bacterium]
MSEIEYYDAVGPYVEKYLVDVKFGEMESNDLSQLHRYFDSKYYDMPTKEL